MCANAWVKASSGRVGTISIFVVWVREGGMEVVELDDDDDADDAEADFGGEIVILRGQSRLESRSQERRVSASSMSEEWSLDALVMFSLGQFSCQMDWRKALREGASAVVMESGALSMFRNCFLSLRLMGTS